MSKENEIVYIAGPMQGYSDFNYPLFKETARIWRAEGWQVLCPAELYIDTSGPATSYLANSVKEMLDCTSIALLKGWERSRGARAEFALAEALNFKMYYADLPGLEISEKLKAIYIHAIDDALLGELAQKIISFSGSYKFFNNEKNKYQIGSIKNA